MVFGEIKDLFFVEKENFDEIVFFVIEKRKETILNFQFGFLSQNFHDLLFDIEHLRGIIILRQLALEPMRINLGGGDFVLIVVGSLLFFSLCGFNVIGLFLLIFFLFDYFLAIFLFFFIFVLFVLHDDRIIILAILFNFIILDVSYHVTDVQKCLFLNFLSKDLMNNDFLLVISLITF